MADDGDAPGRVTFPQSRNDFGNDTRVAYNQAEDKWTLNDYDGSAWEWHPAKGLDAQAGKGRWASIVDQNLADMQAQAYMTAPQSSEAVAGKDKKRKQESQKDAKSANKKQKTEERSQRQNTAIWVTGLPLDTNVSEVNDMFSRYGLIAKEIDSDQPRIKLYKDASTGALKGEALIVYFKAESVMLAVTMLDEAEFRPGDGGSKIRVAEANYDYKKVKGTDTSDVTQGKKEVSQQEKAQAERHKQKITQRTQEMNRKLADWSDDEEPQQLTETSSRWDKVVILKHMFTLKELEEDPAAYAEIKDDVFEECGKLGEVTRLVVYDKEEDGVISVKYGNAEAAKACVRLMNGRVFGGQKVQATIATGREKYKKSKNKDDDDDGDAEENRIGEFGDFLEQDSKLGEQIR
ncbi:MAG: hypothetical protein M1820_000739 [Bogoriella megaspora]|nr:MAG: hypothetical protein M1820_000739 [Bogoriella megaspora]